MKKIILLSIFLLITPLSFADCFINFGGSREIQTLIKEKKFQFDSYDKLCNRLKANDAGILFDTISQISPYQTTVSVMITMYPKGDKYRGRTSESMIWIKYSQERTTNAEKEELYLLTMNALENLASTSSENKLKSMLIEVNEMRKATK